MKSKKTISYVLLIFFKAFFGIAQNNIDGLKFYFSENNPKEYLEGQQIAFETILENTNDFDYPCHKTPQMVIIGLKNLSENIIVPIYYDYSHLYDFSDTVKKIEITPLKANYKARRINIFTQIQFMEEFDFPDDYYLTKYLRSDKYYNNYTPPNKNKFFRLKPGKYEITLACKLYPTTKILYESFQFTVSKPKGENLIYFKEFDEILRISVKRWLSSREEEDLYAALFKGDSSIYSTMLKDLNNPYSEDYFILFLQIYGTDYSKEKLLKTELYKNIPLNLFSVTPQIKFTKSYASLEIFLQLFAPHIEYLYKTGQINDKYKFVDDFLKRVSHLPSKVSETMIWYCKEYEIVDVPLTNYSLLKKNR